MTKTSGMTIGAARLKACKEWPEFSRALWGLEAIPTTALPHAGVDRWWRMYYNPGWWRELAALQAAAVMVHEVWHLLRYHARRAESLVPCDKFNLWNIAADIEIHQDSALYKILRSIPGVKPYGHDSFSPPIDLSMTAEMIFAELQKRNVKSPEGHEGSGVVGHQANWELAPNSTGGLSATEQDQLRRHVARGLLARGSNPASLELWAQEIVSPKVDWRILLAEAFQSVVTARPGTSFWTYSKPARRQPPDPRILLPGWVGESTKLAILIDTSGSMTEQWSQCLAEISELISTMAARGGQPEIVAYSCDAAAYDGQRIGAGNDIQLLGGGGTDLRAGLQAIKADSEKFNFSMVICLTDAVTPWPAGFDIPILTVVFGQQLVPSWLAAWPHAVVRLN